MARSISVKVSTAKVIKALETKLADSEKAIKTNEKKRKEHDKLNKEWAKKVADLVVKQISKADVNASQNWRGEVDVRITIPAGQVTLPDEPEIELEQELGRYEIGRAHV